MPETVGKYEIVERIGRGGMGLVYKARDPILDRFVALKVISTDADITEELRARFFREAQACARLSHPNIVTVYDMGEHEGRLFFVMELLEGDELRKLIAQRKALTLQDKLSIMMQVCDGLHYAHERGIVHRDVKPGNIMLLRNGQVKVLDFGIAQIAATEGGLTRTGLIMGTLRYIAPEQVRGRADHRADIFSVGAVTYELLGLRPPFTGDDPMQLLEQLRTEDPPSLTEVDPTIPGELAAIVQRAMRKQPEQRFQDLEQMRAELEHVQRGLVDETQQVRARLRRQRDRLLQLQAVLAERTGSPVDDETIVAIDERARLTTMRGLESEFERRIETLEARIGQAEALMPALQRGQEFLQSGQFADAVVEFEAIVAEMPEHGRALELLQQARGQAEVHRRRQIATQFLQEARTAFEEGQPSLCLEILKQAVDVSAPTETAAEFASLRASAEAALAAQDAARRLREQAERAREEMTRRRYLARTAGAPQHVPELWSAAEARLAEAQAAFDGQSFRSAIELSSAAAAGYGRAEEAVRDLTRPERRQAEEAQERATLGQRDAVAVDAERLASTLCADAARRFDEARGAFAERQYLKATEAFDAALVLYRRAENQVRELVRRRREQVDQARQRMAERRRLAEAVDAAARGGDEWAQAEAMAASGEGAHGQEAYDDAGRAFDQAAALYRRAEERAREVARALEAARADVDKARQAVVLARRTASERQASHYAAEPWRLAESAEAEASALLEREDYTAGRRLLGEARRHYSAASEAAGIAAEAEVRRLDAMMSDARRLFESGDLTACRRRVNEVLALKPDHPAALLLGRETDEGLQQIEVAAALAAPPASPTHIGTVRVEPPAVAAEAETRRLDAMVSEARRLFEFGDLMACRRRLNEVLALRPDHTEALRLARDADEGLRQMELAAEQAPPPTGFIDVRALRGEPPSVTADVSAPPGGAASAAKGATASREGTVRARTASRDRSAVPGAVAPSRRGLWPAAAVAGCLALGLGAFFLFSRTAPSGAPPAGETPSSAQSAPGPPAVVQPPPAGPGQRSPAASTEAAKEDANRQAAEARLAAERAAADKAAADRAAAAKAAADKLAAERAAAEKAAADQAANAKLAAERAAAEKAAADKAAAERAAAAKAAADKLAAERTAAEKAAVDKAAAAKLAAERAAAEKAVAEQAAQAKLAAERAAAEKAAAEKTAAAKLAAERASVERAAAEKAAAAKTAAEKAAADRAAVEKLAAERAAAEKAAADRAAAEKLAAEKAAAERAAAQRAAAEKLAAERAAAAERQRQQAEALRREAEARQVAMLKATAEEAKTRALMRRDQAVKAEAARLAKDLFSAAEGKLAEADAQARSQGFETANRTYQDAAERYMEAGLRASGVREARTQADSARARMAAEKQRARKESREFAAALAEERQGDALYEKLSYREAAERFRTAEMLFARGAAPPEPPARRRAVPPSF